MRDERCLRTDASKRYSDDGGSREARHEMVLVLSRAVEGWAGVGNQSPDPSMDPHPFMD